MRRLALALIAAGLFTTGCENLSVMIDVEETPDAELALDSGGPIADTTTSDDPDATVDTAPPPRPDSGPSITPDLGLAPDAALPDPDSGTVPDMSTGNLIYANSFEGPSPNVRFTPCGEIGKLPYAYTFKWSSSIVAHGQRALRIENRGNNDNDVCSGITDGKHRAEVKHGSKETVDAQIAGWKAPRWYGFSVYVPADHPQDNPNAYLMTQFNGGSFGPEFWIAMNKNGREFVVNNVYSTDGKTKIKASYGQPRITILKDQWMHFILYRKRAADSDGETRIWVNGQKIVDHKGPNAIDYNVVGTNGEIRFKNGIYWGTSSYDRTYVLYFDNVKIAKGQNEYATVDPQRP